MRSRELRGRFLGWRTWTRISPHNRFSRTPSHDSRPLEITPPVPADSIENRIEPSAIKSAADFDLRFLPKFLIIQLKKFLGSGTFLQRGSPPPPPWRPLPGLTVKQAAPPARQFSSVTVSLSRQVCQCK